MDGDNTSQETGGQLRELKNGAIYDMSIGRIVKAPPPERQPINQENASALAHLRWDKVQAGFIAGGIRALDEISPSQATEGGVIEYLAERAYRQAVSRDDRAGVEWARFYAGGAGLLPDRSRDTGGGPAVRLELSQGAVESLAGLLGGVLALDNSRYPKLEFDNGGAPDGGVVDVGAVDGESQAEIAEVGCDECE